MPQTSRKIAVVGAGSVGATIAYACLMRGVAPQIVLYDINAVKVHAQVLDLNHGLQFVPMASLDGSDDLEICRDADIIVVTAGAKQHPGQSRMDLAAANDQICRTLVPRLVQLSPDAILLMVTNPVDVMTYIALKLSGLPANRVFGSGTVLDSSRFRFLIARHLRLAVQNIHAYIAGEHGDSEVPLWSSAAVAGMPLTEWHVPGHGSITPAERERIMQNVKDAAYQIIQGKGATNYAIGLATARILEAVLKDEDRVLPVSSLIGGHYGIEDVCLSLPCILDRSGIDAVLPIELNDEELAGLRHSAHVIRSALASLGY